MIVNPYALSLKTVMLKVTKNISAARFFAYKIRHMQYKKITDNFSDSPKIFRDIEIETINRCNFNCPFCPVNRSLDPRKLHKMEESLFNKIINDLNLLNFDGRVALHSNNEPFIDERIESFAEIARRELPNAFIHLYTNGSLLTVERLQKIINNINGIIIDNYNDDLQMTEQVKIIHDFCIGRPEINSKVTICLRKQNEVLTTRGGQAPNNEMRKTISLKCIFPWTQFVVRPTGKVSLCCNDATGKYTMGDLTTQSPTEVWRSKEYRDFRKRMNEQGRKGTALCEFCDSHGLISKF